MKRLLFFECCVCTNTAEYHHLPQGLYFCEHCFDAYYHGKYDKTFQDLKNKEPYFIEV